MTHCLSDSLMHSLILLFASSFLIHSVNFTPSFHCSCRFTSFLSFHFLSCHVISFHDILTSCHSCIHSCHPFIHFSSCHFTLPCNILITSLIPLFSQSFTHSIIHLFNQSFNHLVHSLMYLTPTTPSMHCASDLFAGCSFSKLPSPARPGSTGIHTQTYVCLGLLG